MNLDLLTSGFLSHLGQITIGCALISAAISFLIKPQANRKRDLEFVITRSIAGSAIPTGLALILCSFKPGQLSHLEGANLNIAVAGIMLLYISIKAIFSRV